MHATLDRKSAPTPSRRASAQGRPGRPASVLAFHLPLRAAERAGAAADCTEASSRPMPSSASTARQDDAGHAAGGDGPGRLHRAADDPGRGARRRLRARSRSSTRRRTTSSTPIRCSAFRPPAIPIRSALSGRRCARPAPPRGRCWCRPRPQQWQVDPASCTAPNGEVMHAASGRKLAYGDLVDAASGAAAPPDPPLKDPKDFKLIGKPLKRLDTPGKVNGKAVYGIDAMLPGMKFATLAASPVFGGKVGACRRQRGQDDPRRAAGRRARRYGRGGRRPYVGGQAGPGRARHRLGRRAERATQFAPISGTDLRAASEKDGAVAKAVGDVAKGLSQGDRLEADYELPFLAHAPMEPMNCTVQLTPGACEVWLGTQVMARVQATAAKAAGVPLDKVTVHNQLLGGGFGRRLGAGHGRQRRAHRPAGRRAGQGGVDARGGHPARHLSAGLSRPHLREPVRRQDRRLEISRHRLVGHGALAAAGVPERHRHRRRR